MIKKLKILNTLGSHFAPKAKQILDRLGDVDYRITTQNELYNIIHQYDIIVIGISPAIDKEALNKASRLKFIAIPANTLENIDVQYAESKGIEIVSLQGETTFLNTITGVSELAIGLMIDLVRFTPWAFDSVKKHEWLRENFRGHNLYQKTLGIVGMGRLGNLMAKYGQAFEMNIIFYDPGKEKSIHANCTKVTFDELLKKSDMISIHASLNTETEKMFNNDALSKMKKSAYIINTARGKIVDEEALLDALELKTIAGYATDVLANELDFDGIGFKTHPLVEYSKTHKNVIIVPHTGGVTHESRENTDVFTAQKLEKKIMTGI